MPVVFGDDKAVLTAAAALAAARIQGAPGLDPGRALADTLGSLVDRGLIDERYRPAPLKDPEKAVVRRTIVTPNHGRDDEDEERPDWRTV